MNTLYVTSMPFNLCPLGLDAPQCSITFMSDIAFIQHKHAARSPAHAEFFSPGLRGSEDTINALSSGLKLHDHGGIR